MDVYYTKLEDKADYFVKWFTPAVVPDFRTVVARTSTTPTTMTKVMTRKARNMKIS